MKRVCKLYFEYSKPIRLFLLFQENCSADKNEFLMKFSDLNPETYYDVNVTYIVKPKKSKRYLNSESEIITLTIRTEKSK